MIVRGRCYALTCTCLSQLAFLIFDQKLARVLCYVFFVCSYSRVCNRYTREFRTRFSKFGNLLVLFRTSTV